MTGLQKYVAIEELNQKDVMLILNLKPAKLAGQASEAMILCADGKPLKRELWARIQRIA